MSAAGVEPLQLKTAGATPGARLIPRERFCALAHGGSIVAASPTGVRKASRRVELAALDGAKTLIAEACP